MSAQKEREFKIHKIETALRSLISSNDAMSAALLSSIDGHPIAHFKKQDFHESKLAAMTSSCLALGEKISSEANQNGCDFVIIQNETGFIALKRVGKKFVLTALAGTSINLGMLLSTTRNTAEALTTEVG